MSAEDIAAIQQSLVDLGWLTEDGYTSGALDDATVQAISAFQAYCNSEQGMALPVIDTASPTVDAETLSLLTNPDFGICSNPDA